MPEHEVGGYNMRRCEAGQAIDAVDDMIAVKMILDNATNGILLSLLHGQPNSAVTLQKASVPVSVTLLDRR